MNNKDPDGDGDHSIVIESDDADTLQNSEMHVVHQQDSDDDDDVHPPLIDEHTESCDKEHCRDPPDDGDHSIVNIVESDEEQCAPMTQQELQAKVSIF